MASESSASRTMTRRNFLRTTVAVSGIATFGPAFSRTAFATGETTTGVLPAWAREYAPAVSGPFDPGTGMFNWKAVGAEANVLRTKQSLVDSFVSDQHHLFVGDSLTAGWNDSSGNAQGADRDKSWPYVYRRALTSTLGLPEGGTGVVRAMETIGTFASYRDARWSPGPNNVSVIAKGHYVQISNATLTFDSARTGFTPVAGDTVAVTYLDAGTIQVIVDARPAVKLIGGNSGAVKRYVVSGLPRTPHKVVVKAGFGATGKVVGAEVYQQRGISAHNVAQGGSGVTGDVQKDWSYPANGTAALSMSKCFSSFGGYAKTPSTVFICLGANDLNANRSNLGAIRDGIAQTAAYYKANSDIVMIAEPHFSPTFSTVDIKPLLGMLYQLCYDNNWPLWDLEHFTGGYEKLLAAGLIGDATGHFKPEGYALMGKAMAGVVASSLG